MYYKLVWKGFNKWKNSYIYGGINIGIVFFYIVYKLNFRCNVGINVKRRIYFFRRKCMRLFFWLLGREGFFKVLKYKL